MGWIGISRSCPRQTVLRFASAITLLLPTALADTNPAFEVATVKTSEGEPGTRRFTIRGRQFLTFNTTLADLIQFAFGLHLRQIVGGPPWLESQRFNIVGLAAGIEQPTEREWMKMMASLIVERFHLRHQMERRELPVFAITRDQDGVKLEPSGESPDSLPSIAFRGRGQLVARNANIRDLAWELQSAVLDAPVVDNTGLTARFHFTLSWTPDEFQTSALLGEARGEDDVAPNLFAAIRQQLGLRLVATKSSAEVMRIEQVTMPDQN
jgi:uncharacterized protein (TIGR03435 family)